MKRVVLFVLCLLVLPLSVSAQDAAWETVLFNPNTYELVYLTPDGVRETKIFAEFGNFNFVHSLVMSPDGKWLAFIGDITTEDGSTSTSDVYIANVEAGTCCTLLTNPAIPELEDELMGTFSPDGTQLALLRYSFQDMMDGTHIPAQVTVFDVASGTVASTLSVDELTSPFEGPIPGALLSEWDAAGLHVVASCVGCEPALDGLFQIWNPATGELSEPIEPYNLLKRELDTTGEAVLSVQNPNYPAVTEGDFMIPPGNVVEYFADASSEQSDAVVYFNPDQLGIQQVEWVADGNAILVMHMQSSSAFVVMRDGSQIPVSIPPNFPQFIAGTPDGWLMTNPDEFTVDHYIIQNGGVILNPLTTFEGYVQPVSSIPLGTTATPGFVAIQ